MKRQKKEPITAEQQRERMLTMSMPKLILSMIIPTVLCQLITVFYNTADTFFVARIGTSAAAAVGIVFSLQSIMQAYGYAVGTGVGSLVARCLGAAQYKAAERYVATSAVMAVAGALVIMTPCLLFLEPLMHLLGSTETILPYSMDYAFYILLGCPFMCLQSTLGCILRNEGEPTYAVMGTISGGFLNLVLNPVLIFGLGWGIRGAGIATSLGQVLSTVILLAAFYNGKSAVALRLRSTSKNWQDYTEIFTTGIPTLSRQGMASVGSAVLNICAARYGDAAVAAITIANKIYLFVRNIVIGVGQGFQPAAGFNFSAGEKKRTREAFVFCTQLGTVICLAFALAIGFNAEMVMGWFRDDAEVLAVGRPALIAACVVMPMMAYSTFVNQLYQCLGFKVQATLLACCRNGFCLIPVVFILPFFLGIYGIALAQPVADLLTFLISVPFQTAFFKYKLSEEGA